MGRRWRNLTVGWLVAAGCGPADRPAPVPVRGAVTFQGRPLAGGTIVFAPDTDRGTPGRPSAATLSYRGEYQFTDDQKLLPGWYRIAVAEAPTTSGGLYGFPAALRRPDRSGIAREVRPGGENILDFGIELPD